MARTLIVGNWKMNGTISSNSRLLQKIKDDTSIKALQTDVAVCVPFLHVPETQRTLTGSTLKWGVQDVSAFREGAYTGEISAEMVAEFGATYAIVGHSERRSYHGEALTTVGDKAFRAIEAGITPIVCVGESLREREDGAARETVETQLLAVLDALPASQPQDLVLAYEPVWAIGTGHSASPEQVQEMHAFIRRLLRTRSGCLADTPILYGGSVKPATAAELFAQNDVDGALVGGASLEARSFLDIIRAAANQAMV